MRAPPTQLLKGGFRVRLLLSLSPQRLPSSPHAASLSPVPRAVYWLGLLTHLQSDEVPRKRLPCLRDLVVMYEACTVDDVYEVMRHMISGGRIAADPPPFPSLGPDSFPFSRADPPFSVAPSVLPFLLFFRPSFLSSCPTVRRKAYAALAMEDKDIFSCVGVSGPQDPASPLDGAAAGSEALAKQPLPPRAPANPRPGRGSTVAAG